MSEVLTESGFIIERAGELSFRVTQTPGRVSDVRATAYRYDVLHSDAELELHLLWAANGERWVEARNVSSLVPMLARLEGRLRLTIESHRDGVSFAALRQATPKSENWSNLADVTLTELSHAAGVPIMRELRRVGAVDVGPRSIVLEDTGRSRNRLVVSFPDENEVVPILAYALTRLAPLVNMSIARNGLCS